MTKVVLRTGALRTSAVLFISLLLFALSIKPQSVTGGPSVLAMGRYGPEVVYLQYLLHRWGLLNGDPDGIFGPETAAAVREFQRRHGLPVDGKVGPATWQALSAPGQGASHHRVRPGETLWTIARRYGVTVNELIAANDLVDPDRIRSGVWLTIPGRDGTGPALALWSEVNKVFRPGEVARVIDVQTGRSFMIRRFRGSEHADVEPLTRQDTLTMLAIYGGSWSWQRRAIVVEYGGRQFAASMNGQPHGRGAVSENEFPGHFCIHFLGSRTHGTRRIDFEHHRQMMRAAGYDSEPVWVRYFD